ncbi:uncharacterized protein LOC111316577 [Durio zibethinus]|uniref:Uncharacterized protein LOC111316577 n=1 Tax=Durio zibethinus TaxID=66656 RepID=A0A6P6BB30_DURZI|nr:uncharacterized protein LOC111316577 [Durio zibethinus]
MTWQMTVQDMTNEEIVAVEVDSSENVRLDSSSKKTSHLRVKIAKMDQFPVPMKGIKKLRSLVTVGQQCDVTGEALQALFEGAKGLRVVDFTEDFSGGVTVKEIPNEIGKLIHLRYLNLCHNRNLEELPEGMSELQNLHT